MLSILKKIGSNLWHFLYNEDRALASIAGSPPEETISSEIGRHKGKNPVATAGSVVLDAIQKDHVELAKSKADALDKSEAQWEANHGNK